MGYKIEIRQREPHMRSAIVVWSRYRDTMPAAIDAAEEAVIEMHKRNGMTDERDLGIDIDCARGWNPRTAPVIIERGSYTVLAKGN